jgi:hypothetical protein
VIAEVSGQTLLVFVGIPALIIAVVSLLVFAPSIAKGPRYRPGLSWWAPPVWVGGPSAAVDAPQLEAGAAGSAAGAGAGAPAPALTTGGASASW